MHLAISIMVQFIRSATPFCSGVYGAVVWCLMPCCIKYSWNMRPMYSPPLSVRNALMREPDSFSATALNLLKCSFTSSLLLITYSHTLRVQSSMNLTKYRAPPILFLFIGPHTSECTSSSFFVARVLLALGKLGRSILPSAQALHGTVSILSRTSISLTKCFVARSWSPFTPICPASHATNRCLPCCLSPHWHAPLAFAPWLSICK